MPKSTTVDPTGVEINGARLRHLRKLRGLTITAFAERCRLHFTYISHIERGYRKHVSPAAFVTICDALDIHADQRDTMLTPSARRRAKAAA